MPKMKTKRAAAKRFKVTGNGLIRRHKAFSSHILTKKSRKRKRSLRQMVTMSDADSKRVHLMLPYHR